MTEADESQLPEDIPDRERSRIQHRDKKRRTEMVVDNAGIKRIAKDLAEKRNKSTGRKR